LSRFVTL